MDSTTLCEIWQRAPCGFLETRLPFFFLPFTIGEKLSEDPTQEQSYRIVSCLWKDSPTIQVSKQFPICELLIVWVKSMQFFPEGVFGLLFIFCIPLFIALKRCTHIDKPFLISKMLLFSQMSHNDET